MTQTTIAAGAPAGSGSAGAQLRALLAAAAPDRLSGLQLESPTITESEIALAEELVGLPEDVSTQVVSVEVQGKLATPEVFDALRKLASERTGLAVPAPEAAPAADAAPADAAAAAPAGGEPAIAGVHPPGSPGAVAAEAAAAGGAAPGAAEGSA